MRICLLCTNEKVKGRLERHFGEKHQLEGFDKTSDDLSIFDAVLIVEPYLVKGQYLSICLVWRNFLKIHYPEMKLLVAGFEGKSTYNYLPLLDFSEGYDLAAAIKKAKTAEGAGDELFLLGGYDQVVEKLKLFFSGHNQESIIDLVGKVRSLLNNAELSIYGEPHPQKRKRTLFPGLDKTPLGVSEECSITSTAAGITIRIILSICRFIIF